MSKKPDGFTTFILLAIIVFATPLLALLSAAIYSEAWDMLLAKQYGAGPTYQSWYGLSILSVFATQHLIKPDKDDNDSPIYTAIARTVGQYLGLMLVLLIAFFVTLALGWS